MPPQEPSSNRLQLWLSCKRTTGIARDHASGGIRVLAVALVAPLVTMVNPRSWGTFSSDSYFTTLDPAGWPTNKTRELWFDWAREDHPVDALTYQYRISFRYFLVHRPIKLWKNPKFGKYLTDDARRARMQAYFSKLFQRKDMAWIAENGYRSWWQRIKRSSPRVLHPSIWWFCSGNFSSSYSRARVLQLCILVKLWEN